jgi:23S rRNA (pseudouridine1915-N3)-methyltransferase
LVFEAGSVKVRVMWPGKTRNEAARRLEKMYVDKINRLGSLDVVVTRTAKGISEKESDLIKKMEAESLEQHLHRDSEYIVCLSDAGEEMNSREFSQLMREVGQSSSKRMVFLVGGFLGFHSSLIEKADLIISLSRMTFSHDLCRILLLEQIYRSMSEWKGRKYAK